ncbi:MAG: hypothetical protein LBT60_01500 [Oscillospiraceae bacterium]|jgi:hypothetical protein|nr:hypothetical protein [Oscillospiraceae bacterium]
MLFPFDLILTAAPPDTREAAALTRRVAHLAYRVGPGLSLLRGSIGASMRGGLMALSDEDCDGQPGDTEALCHEVLRECSARNFEGVVADFEQTCAPQLEPFVERLAPALRQRRLSLYVTPLYAGLAEDATVIIPTALVSGSLRERLAQAREHFGPRLALELERIARDITLPDAQGQGLRLDRDQLHALAEGRQVFFSRELCSHYFTYKDRKTQQTHFVLFDDAQSLLKKMSLASGMGIREGFLLYPDAKGIWETLNA